MNRVNTKPAGRALWRYVLALGGVGTLTAVLWLFRTALEPTNLVMLYVPLVALVALVSGRSASVVASILAFLAYNFFFVPPFYTFGVERPQDVIELVILLIVALVVGTLVARARAQAQAAAEQAERMTALYQVSQEISAVLAVEEILPRIAHTALRLLHGDRISICLTGDGGTVAYETHVGSSVVTSEAERAPLTAAGKTFGELQVWPKPTRALPDAAFRPLLTTLATQAAVAIERTHLAEVALHTRVLEESERLKSALLSSVSHDLRTPLAVIKGASSNLLDPGVAWDRETTQRFLESIDLEADRLNRLVRNLLEMSRLEAGALSCSRELVAIGDIIGAALARLRASLAAHPTTVALEPGLPEVLADPVQLELVLTNLLENAAKYAPPDSPIEIGAQLHGSTLDLTVADRGPGIPPGDERRMFEKFVRLGGATSTSGGSGLGLTIAKGIVEAHGGCIRAHNRPGGGAVLTLSLPIRQPSPPVRASA